MKHLVIRTLLSALACALCACSGGNGYVIDCQIEGLGEHGLEMISSDGLKMATRELHPHDGKVKIEGKSPELALVELFTLDGRLLYTCAVKNGDRLKVSFNVDSVSSTLSVEGNPDMELLAGWISANDSVFTRGTDSEVNSLIARLVSENPASMASTLLVVGNFRTRGNELMADSVLNLIDAQARPLSLSGPFLATLGQQTATDIHQRLPGFTMFVGRDTVVAFTPGARSYTLLAFSDRRKPDSTLRSLKALYKDMPQKRFELVEASLATDSLSWRAAISADSARWKQGWLAGGPASPRIAPLAIPAVPFYIVTDSVGQTLYRGASLKQADSLVRQMLGKPSQTSEPVEAATEAAAKPTDTPRRPGPEQDLGPGTLKLQRVDN
ncbi:MAG: hypothetical protein NC339_02845 [Muribaculaceae bacterium]|nr:hypothetical protein [Muribaculaceae bacterium]